MQLFLNSKYCLTNNPICAYHKSMKLNIRKLKKEMKRLGLSQTELGLKMKPPMTRQGVSYIILTGKTKFATVDIIAKALNITPKDLIL